MTTDQDSPAYAAALKARQRMHGHLSPRVREQLKAKTEAREKRTYWATVARIAYEALSPDERERLMNDTRAFDLP